MKKIIISLIILVSGMSAWSQNEPVTQDPAAREILDRVAARAKNLKSIQADFQLVIEDKKDNSRINSSGNLILKKDKYKISNKESAVYFNGKTMWTYTLSNQEVIITEPEINEDDFMNNPASIFSLYNKDFKYRYLKETTKNGVAYDEIDMFPKDLDQPFSRVKLLINKKSDLPGFITSYGKDGVNYTFTLTNFKLDMELSDDLFSFDPAKNKKVEVIDMRGTK